MALTSIGGLWTPRLLLLPYQREHVATYHAWMSDPWLREMTASERLSEDEEYAAQVAWASDPSKCTFIVFDRAAHVAGGGGVAGMCGDANLFLLAPDSADAELFRDRGSGGGGGVAEVMVMIADAASRRRGYACEAVEALLAFAAAHMQRTRFVAKVSDANEPSLKLFSGALGFRVARAVPAFAETHLVRIVEGGGQGGSSACDWRVLPQGWKAGDADPAPQGGVAAVPTRSTPARRRAAATTVFAPWAANGAGGSGNTAAAAAGEGTGVVVVDSSSIYTSTSDDSASRQSASSARRLSVLSGVVPVRLKGVGYILDMQFGGVGRLTNAKVDPLLCLRAIEHARKRRLQQCVQLEGSSCAAEGDDDAPLDLAACLEGMAVYVGDSYARMVPLPLAPSVPRFMYHDAGICSLTQLCYDPECSFYSPGP